MALVAAALIIPASGSATTFEPTRFDDPTPGACKPNNCSLREALIAAGNRDGRDKIQLRKGRYEMEIPPSGDDTGSFDFRDEGILTGVGAGKTKVDGNGLDGVFLVGADNELNDDMTIKNLTITGGDNPQFGGGIQATSFESDTLTLKRVRLTRNQANFGGGIHADLAQLRVLKSLITRNTAATHGGGMRLGTSSTSPTAEAVIKDSRITRNEGLLGGGIYDFFPNTTITRTTIDDNTADEGGGVLQGGWLATPVTSIRASTISRNKALKGAGLLADGDQPGVSFEEPTVNVLNSTIALNEATGAAGGILSDNVSTVALDNVTVAHNAADADSTGGGVGAASASSQGPPWRSATRSSPPTRWAPPAPAPSATAPCPGPTASSTRARRAAPARSAALT